MSIEIVLPKNINDTIEGVTSLVSILDKIHSVKDNDKVVLNFSDLEWIDANMLSAFGAVLEENFERIKLKYVIGSISPKIENLLERNGFGRYFKFDKTIDESDTVIDYTITDGKEIKKFASYFQNRVLKRQQMPRMSEG